MARCLRSLPPGCEIIVLDSNSTDRTEQIALQHGAAFHKRVFTDYADQKNAAVALAKRSWILSIDADEELDGALRDAICGVVTGTNTGGHAPHAYYLPRRLVFMDQVMRFGKTSDWPLRLVRRGAGKFEGTVHEQIKLPAGARIERLNRGALMHHSYENLTDYFSKFNRYTSQVAARNSSSGRAVPFVSLALRPWGEFVGRYFLRLGFLDGYPGYCYALLSSFYTFVKHAKLRELRDGA